eukprot:COSAG02_NODE_79_length_40228_cov_18.435762_36_plen_196_part_00
MPRTQELRYGFVVSGSPFASLNREFGAPTSCHNGYPVYVANDGSSLRLVRRNDWEFTDSNGFRVFFPFMWEDVASSKLASGSVPVGSHTWGTCDGGSPSGSATVEIVSWCREGAVVIYDSKVGVVLANPHSTGQAEVRWSDGESDEISSANLAPASVAAQRKAASWCRTGARGSYHGRIGSLTMSADSDAEVKIE